MSEDWTQWEGRIVDEKYPLLRYLGAGEQSVVFQTEHHEGAKAAIKLLPADSRDPELQLSQWERAAGLAHPNLISLHHSGRGSLDETELLYVVMDHAEEDMSKVLEERPLSEDEVRDMVEPVLSALVYLHGEGLAHAQLKPSNILAVGDNLKISSDGVCRAGTTGRPASKYDPPEFESAGASAAGDVWSFGVTLVEALTRQLPEHGVPSSVPASFRDTVEGCLQEDPRRRPTVQELVARFRPVPTLATPVAAPPVVRPAVPPPPPVRPSAPPPPREADPAAGPAEASGNRPRYLLPVAALGIVAVAIFAGTKLSRGPEPASTAPPVAVEAPAPAPPAVVDPAPKVASRPKSAPAKAGEVLHELMPDIDAKARRTIRGKVKVSVRVSVDAAGRVTKSRFESAGPSRYLAGLSEKAARQWKFRPATVDGREVPSEWLVRFEITRSGTVARATRASR